MSREKKHAVKGSYTIEAALLMGMILMILVSVIYLGFYFHDQGFAIGAAYESACQAALHKEEKDYSVAAVSGELVKGRFLGMKNVTVTAKKEKENVRVAYEGKMNLPGMITVLFRRNQLQVKREISMSIQKPSEKIQKIRGAVKIIQRVRGK